MKVIPSIPGVLHLEFPTRKELTLSMCRIEEFYESPYDNIRGKIFTWDEFLETYTKEDGTLDYFAYWDGFNVPGNVVQWFFCAHVREFSTRENTIYRVWQHSKTEYLIATQEGCAQDIVEHELAHARYYLNQNYKARMDNAIANFGTENMYAITQGLLSDTRYADKPELLNDEIQAYLATSEYPELEQKFPLLPSWEIIRLQRLYSGILGEFKKEEQCAS
jgi:hypothetical protein